MWMLPLYLHANKKSAASAAADDDEDDVCVKVLKNQIKALIGGCHKVCYINYH